VLQRGTTIIIQYVHFGGARRSIRRRDDGLYQIWKDNIFEGLGEEYDDYPEPGLFGTLTEAREEFLRSNQGFEVERNNEDGLTSR
jgi:hypothetical protein